MRSRVAALPQAPQWRPASPAGSPCTSTWPLCRWTTWPSSLWKVSRSAFLGLSERGWERRRSRSPSGANEKCSEEVWQRRSAHRAAGVAAVKRSADYISAAASPRVPRPNTPDPTERMLSKRAWERGVQQWRMDLKAVAQLLPPDWIPLGLD